MYILGSAILNLYFLISNISGISWFSVDFGRTCQMKKMNQTEKYYYILLWKSPETNSRHELIENYFNDHKLYEKESCLYQNCLFTHSKDLMSIDKYDAILYNGRNLGSFHERQFPNRTPNQTYVFVQFEPSQHYRVHNTFFNDFFNITITYRLDSDIPTPYLKTSLLNGTTIDPREKIPWQLSYEPLLNKFKINLRHKTRLVAWFVSRCRTMSRREDFVDQLINALDDLGFNQTVDTYGLCGNLRCPRRKYSECVDMLSKNYMFYLAFENSFAVDYVTEKVLTAIAHDTVPIVYGGADYHRMLPEGSYLDACRLGPKRLAWTLVYLYKNRNIYETFFTWKNFYKVEKTDLEFTSGLCKLLNARNNQTRTRYNLLSWWNRANYRKCDFACL